MKVAITPIVIRSLSTVTKGFIRGTGELGNKKTSGDHPNNSIINIGQNTEKSPGELRRLAPTQSPVEKHQLTLV